MKRMNVVCLCAGLLGTMMAAQAQDAAKDAKPAKTPRNSYLQAAGYLLAAGDLDGDRRDEVVTWNGKTRRLSVLKRSGGGELREVTATTLDGFPTALTVADADGDGRPDVLLGEGLPSTNPADVMQTEVRLRLYHPLAASGWTPTEIFRGPTSRPDVVNIEVASARGTGKPEILFQYYASKYQVSFAVARSRGAGWDTQPGDSIRMGSHVALARVSSDGQEQLVVGRPYGDPEQETDPKTGKVREKVSIGDAFILDGGTRTPLPVYRGVSSVAVGRVSGGQWPDIVVGDGWHSDYGKLARARVALMHREAGKWSYELIEDIPGFIRVVQIQLADLDGDGKAEILALAEEPTTQAPALRLYQRAGSRWRGTTLATGSGAFVAANLDGSRQRELILSGAEEPRGLALDLRHVSWDAQLAQEQRTFLADPAALVGKPAPELVAEEWIGPGQSLDALRGHVVLLDFWATWCTPCIKSFPALQGLLTQYGPQGFSIVGLTNHSEQSSEDVRQFLKRKPLGWPVGIDAKSRPHMAYGTQGLPHQVLIDRKGVVRFFYVGGEQHDKIEQDVRTLLAEQA